MSYVLSVYSTAAFKEVLLPALDNSDWNLNLDKDLFGFAQDLILPMEVIDGEWRFVDLPQDCNMYYTDNCMNCCGVALQHDDMLTVCRNGEQEHFFIIVRKTDRTLTVYPKYSLRNVNFIYIGKDEDNHIQFVREVNGHSLISHHHARLQRNGDVFVLMDDSKNGTFINEKRIVGEAQVLKFGDLINIYGLKILFFNEFLAIDTSMEGLRIMPGVLEPYTTADVAVPAYPVQNEEDTLFHRSPRNIPKLETEPVEIEAPPTAKEHVTMPTFMAIGPSLTMALPMLLGTGLMITSSMASGGQVNLMMFAGIVTALGSSIIGTFWAIRNMKAQKVKNREEELKRFEMYKEYLLRCAADIKAKYENNMKVLHYLYHPADECTAITRSNIELWNRNERHGDFLQHRVGTGRIPFQVEIKVPKERFSMIHDSLNERPAMMRDSYKYLNNVPVCVDLCTNRLIGLIGGKNYQGCYRVMHDLVAQIAASNCYTDVKLAFVYDRDRDESDEEWSFTRWLPHVWSADGKVRYVATDRNEAGDVFYELTNVLRFRAEEGKNRRDGAMAGPYYILFLENPELLEGELLAKYVYDKDENYGLTTVLLVQSYDELPNACEYIIENTDRYHGMYYVTDGEDDRVSVDFDITSSEHMEAMARRLSSIKVKEEVSGGEIPGALTFFDMYGISRLEELHVAERWRKNRTYETLRALVGQKAGGVDCYLDVHEKYHGPHGLVAGTTGSGKSETLQTYMLSLAINYSPDDVGFFIIDYKGGGMANLFNGLPHMIGQISNLSGNQVHRAMVSIKSENMRRQRIFNEHGVNNINLYTRLYKNNEASRPVPHMFIIIDEFAELKREEPEFMRELISVAQVGRSLGVHLILATQKPAGTVDDNIWSNSKFRLCLRVQDRQDSMDMLHKADAAYLTQAGRCYMQVGNDELYELFQSGYSGAAYDTEGSVQTDIARMLADNGKAALVGSHAQLKRKERVRNRWIKTLMDITDIAANRINVNIPDCREDKSLSAVLAAEFFKVAEEMEVEYPVSDYNTHRVMDFIEIYSGCLEETELPKEQMPELICNRASDKNRKLPEAKEKTQLSAVVEYLAKMAKDQNYRRDLQLWLPVLPEVLYLTDLDGYSKRAFNGVEWQDPGKRFSLETMIGLYDDPENQAQNPVTVNIAESGNLAIVGATMTGKSTSMMTLIYSMANFYSPDVVNFYIMDFSSKALGALEGLPHVGAVMYEDDLEVISKFFTFLNSMIRERKKIFQGGNYSQYVQANGRKVPALVIVIDNFAAFRTKTDGKYDDLIANLLKEVSSYGIYFAVTAAGFGMAEIPGRMADQFRQVLTLEMTDRYGYTEALRTMRLDVLPEENVKGRGLARISEMILEYQTALALPAEDDFARGEKLKKRCAELAEAWKGRTARKIPTIPEHPVWGEYAALDEVIRMAEEKEYLPIGYDRRTASPYGICFRSIYSYVVSGKSHTGKTNLLKNIIAAAALAGIKVTVIDLSGFLEFTAAKCGADYITDAKGIVDFIGNDLFPDFKKRNQEKKECVTKGMTDDEIYAYMQKFEKRIIVIDDLPKFVKAVRKPGEGIADRTTTVCSLLDKGALHNVFWFAAFDQDQTSEVAGIDIFTHFTKDKNGIHLGGNVQAQRLMSFDHINYSDQGKKTAMGIGLLPTHDEDEVTTVVIPLYRTE